MIDDEMNGRFEIYGNGIRFVDCVVDYTHNAVKIISYDIK